MCRNAKLVELTPAVQHASCKREVPGASLGKLSEVFLRPGGSHVCAEDTNVLQFQSAS